MNIDLIDREALKKWVDDSISQYGNQYSTDMLNMFGLFREIIDNAPTVYPKQGEWYDFIPKCLKARHGEYVLYKVDFLLDNLAREVNIMESARRMKGGAEE